ncbi:hypothetical protein C8R42DRAFT_648953 [Lentinula raphanica]|nr:hypothetical protein C8R42DRAFT_648953 [Lentinula raphanica]
MHYGYSLHLLRIPDLNPLGSHLTSLSLILSLIFSLDAARPYAYPLQTLLERPFLERCRYENHIQSLEEENNGGQKHHRPRLLSCTFVALEDSRRTDRFTAREAKGGRMDGRTGMGMGMGKREVAKTRTWSKVDDRRKLEVDDEEDEGGLGICKHKDTSVKPVGPSNRPSISSTVSQHSTHRLRILDARTTSLRERRAVEGDGTDGNGNFGEKGGGGRAARGRELERRASSRPI